MTTTEKRILVELAISKISYGAPCDFDGNTQKDSRVGCEFEALIPNGFGESFHLNLCQSCLRNISQLSVKLEAQIQREVLEGLREKVEARKDSLERQMKSSRNIDTRLTQAKRQSMIDTFEWVLSQLKEIEEK